MLTTETLRNIRLIIFDLDGSLLKNDGTIGDETKHLIKKHGVLFSFATGRLHSAITKYAEILDIKTPLISLDGCLIKNHPEGKIIFESFVPTKYVSQVLGYYENYIHETLEVVLAANSFTVINNIREAVSFPFLSRVNTSFFQSHSHPGIYYLEIRKKGSSKGKGLERLTNYLNIHKRNTAVVCDWYNDISLLQKPVTKIAMQNAIGEVKELADFVTSKTNNEDGAAEFLEQVLKSKIK